MFATLLTTPKPLLATLEFGLAKCGVFDTLEISPQTSTLNLSVGWNLRNAPMSTLITPGPRNAPGPQVAWRIARFVRVNHCLGGRPALWRGRLYGARKGVGEVSGPGAVQRTAWSGGRGQATGRRRQQAVAAALDLRI